MPIAATYISNAPHTNTGYGTQSRQLLPRIVADGHKIAVQANYGLEATTTDWNGIPMYPRGYDQWCNDMVAPAFRDWTRRWPDHTHLIMGLFDAWVMSAPILSDPEIPVLWWTPIDHMPIPPRVRQVISQPNWMPVAMSRFGERMMQEVGLEPYYAPHAIDSSLYQHRPTVVVNDENLTGRTIMGFPEDGSEFIVASFDANKGIPSRKAWGERALAMAVFMERHKDAWWYLHTERTAAFGGVDFEHLLRTAGVDVNRVKFVNQWALRMGIPDEAMAALYSAADVVLMPSMGEGFGLCALESQSTGARVILTDCTAQTELCGPDSYLIPGQPWYDAPQGAFWTTPDVRKIVDALDDAYSRRGSGPSKANRRFAQQWEADKIYREHWRPILLDVQERWQAAA